MLEFLTKIDFVALAIGILPTLVLSYYIYSKDNVEKEPPLLLCLLFGSGAICFALAKFVVRPFACGLLDKMFESRLTINVMGGQDFATDGDKYLFHVIMAFICFALVEELLKWIALLLITKWNKNFNCLFDGIIYSVFVSLGFGIVESVIYAISNGADSLLLYLVDTAPAHFFYGVIMGFFYTLWHVNSSARRIEKQMIADGTIEKHEVFPPVFLCILSLLLPVMLNGFARFSDALDTPALNIANGIIVAVLYILCFVITFIMSRKDSTDGKLVSTIIFSNHPELRNTNAEEAVEARIVDELFDDSELEGNAQPTADANTADDVEDAPEISDDSEVTDDE